ncbi:MAG: hypothetical protein MRY57_01555 [Candidatus Pacebacteria bacterium]|nr:hypothetical protein [Candidatus Paceibacterota bacterium]
MKKYSASLRNFLFGFCESKKRAKKWLAKTRSNIYPLRTLEQLSEKELANELQLSGHIIYF